MTTEHPRDDGLTSYVWRIKKAVAYNGQDDHEDVRSILKERDQSLKQKLLAAMPEAENFGNGIDDLVRLSDITKAIEEVIGE